MIKPPLLLFDWFEIDVMGDCFLTAGWVDDYGGCGAALRIQEDRQGHCFSHRSGAGTRTSRGFSGNDACSFLVRGIEELAERY
jgi:hypothetical protein